MRHSLLRFVTSSATLCLILIASPALAQQDAGTTTGTGTGGAGIGPAEQATVGIIEADTSAFTLDRGGSIGGAEGQGFGREDASAAGGATAGRGGGGLGGLGGGGLGGLFGGLFGNATQGAQSNRPTVRVRLRSAVAVAPIQPAAVQANAVSRLQQLPTNRAVPNVSVSMQGRTAILSGTVQSNRDRRMSQLLMRLEPGVSNVENRISVVGQ